ncbi:MAG: hypothetical protein JO257_10735 [Deltaproteobacteria bacterium]|nr:hypothetical protein [Deltaproteobacteria bacterium]
MPDVLGESEREDEATRALGRWRERTRTTWLAIFAVGGLVPAGIGYWGLTELQFRMNDWASLRISVLGAVLPFIGCLFAGRFIGNRVVRARMMGQVDRLARLYEIPAERLAETARLLVGI